MSSRATNLSGPTDALRVAFMYGSFIIRSTMATRCFAISKVLRWHFLGLRWLPILQSRLAMEAM